ncbi:MAG: hypothetical protein AB2598_10000 [Candidatus Thiodiazotropha sp.]
MKTAITGMTLLLLLITVPPSHAERNTAQEQTQEAPVATTHTKQYSSQSANRVQYSRKCAIYSGVCPMGRKTKVGDYCICNTPSGPIHGVVIP